MADRKFWNAIDSSDIELQEKIFKEIIAKHPDHFDARRNLATILFENDEIEEAFSQYREVHIMGMSLIPAEFVWGEDSIPNHFTDNRSFLESIRGLGRCHLRTRDQASAIPFFELVIKLNPDEMTAKELLDDLDKWTAYIAGDS